MASLSATSLRFQPSFKLSIRTTQGCYTSTSFGAVSVGWSKRQFPSLRSNSRFRIDAVQARPETMQKVCQIVRQQLALPSETALTSQTKFSELGADSLDTVEIVMSLEEAFGINVQEDSSENIATVQDVADLIETLIQEKGAPPVPGNPRE